MMKLTKTNARGFTLIELLVVIAIIGILASVVLASLNSARDKGQTAAIKSSINNARAQAELVYDNAPRSYAALCTDPTIVNIRTSVAAAGGSVATGNTSCESTATAYRISSVLVGTPTTYYCVDSAGKAYTGATSPSGTGCP